MSDKDNTDFYVMYCCPGCHAQFHTKDTLISHIYTCVKKSPTDVSANDAANKEDKIETDDIKSTETENKDVSVFPDTVIDVAGALPNKMSNPSASDSPSHEESMADDPFKVQSIKGELEISKAPRVFPVSLRIASTHLQNAEEETPSSQPVVKDSQDLGNSEKNDDIGPQFKISSVTSLTDQPSDIDGFEMECEDIQVERYSDVEESDTEEYFHHAGQQLLLTPVLARSTNIVIQPQKIEQPTEIPQVSNVIDEATKDNPNFIHRIVHPIVHPIKGASKIHPRTIIVTPSKPQKVRSAGSQRKVRMPSNCEISSKKIVPRKTPPGTLLLIPQGKKTESEEGKTSTDPTQQTNGNTISDTSQTDSKPTGTTTKLLLIPIKKSNPVLTTSSFSSIVSKQSISTSLGQSVSTVMASSSSNLSPMLTSSTVLLPGLMNATSVGQGLGTNIPIPSIAALPMSVMPSPVNNAVSGVTPVQNTGIGQFRFPLSPAIQPSKSALNNPLTCSNPNMQFFVNANGQICISPIQNSLNPILVQNTNPAPAATSSSLVNPPAPVSIQNFQAAPIMTQKNVITVTVDSSGKVLLVPALNAAVQGQIPQPILNPSTNQSMLLAGAQQGSLLVQQIPGQNSTPTLLPANITTPIPAINAPNISSLFNSAKSIPAQNSINKALTQNSANSTAASNQMVSSHIISPTSTSDNQNSKTSSAVKSSTVSTLEINSTISPTEQSSPAGLKIHQSTLEASEPTNESKAVPTGLSIPLILWPGNTASSNKADLPAIINLNSDLGKLFELHPEILTKKPFLKEPTAKITPKDISIFNVKTNALALHGYSRADVKIKKHCKPQLVTVETGSQTDFTEFPELIVIKKEKTTKCNLKKSPEDEKAGDEFSLMMTDYSDDQPKAETVRRSSRIRSKPQKSYVEESDDSEDEIDYGEFVIDRDKQLNNRFRIVGTQTLYEKLVADVTKDLIKIEQDSDSSDENQYKKEKDPDFDPYGNEKVDTIVEEIEEEEENESFTDHSDTEESSAAEYIKRTERLKKINTNRQHPRDLDLEKHSEKYTVEVTLVGELKREIYKCTFCDIGLKVLTEDALKRHLYKHVDKRYFCPFCPLNDLSGNFTDHIIEDHSDQLKCVCDSCGKAFMDNRKLAVHRSKEHEEYLINCDYCEAGFTYHSTFIRHLRDAHNSQGLHVCPTCDKNFVDEKLFIMHCKYAKCEKQKTEQLCQECGMVVASKDQLASHIKRVHMKERHYMCDLCSFTCYQMTQLKDHKTIHTREYQYKCPHCDFRAAKQVQVTSHVRIHTGDKPYKCDQCNYRSAWNIQLRTHRGAHYSRFMVMCDPCGIAFKDDRGLHLHQKKRHSGKDEEKGDNSDTEEEMEFSAEDDNSDTEEHTKSVKKAVPVNSKRKRCSTGKNNSSVKKSRKSNNQKEGEIVFDQ